MSRYNIKINELNFTLDNGILNFIEERVIFEVINTLSDKILSDFNFAIINFIIQEIKNLKKKKLNINIPNDLINKINKISDNIYKNLGNISDDDEEEGKKINNMLNKDNKCFNKNKINYLINDDD